MSPHYSFVFGTPARLERRNEVNDEELVKVVFNPNVLWNFHVCSRERVRERTSVQVTQEDVMTRNLKCSTSFMF